METMKFVQFLKENKMEKILDMLSEWCSVEGDILLHCVYKIFSLNIQPIEGQ